MHEQERASRLEVWVRFLFPVEIGVKLMKMQSLCVYGNDRGSVVTAY